MKCETDGKFNGKPCGHLSNDGESCLYAVWCPNMTKEG